VGKPVGIVLFSWSAERLGVAARLDRVSWRQMIGADCLCGIGFTMSLFVGTLAFGESETLAAAKLGIMMGSGTAPLIGSALLSRKPPGP
jgi:Na+:H+ antiporter, NhaA family